MSAESSAAIIRRMGDADNAASMRQLEGDLAGALALLSQAAEELERHAPMDTPAWQVALVINAFVDQHRAPETWRRGGAT